MSNEGNEGGSRRQLVAAVFDIAVIVLGGLGLSAVLHRSDTVQDCAMSGRTNGGPTEVPR